MAKGQMRSNKEVRKPKADKKAGGGKAAAGKAAEAPISLPDTSRKGGSPKKG